MWLLTSTCPPLPSEFNDLRGLLVDCYNLAYYVPGIIEVYNENTLQRSCLALREIARKLHENPEVVIIY